MTAPSMPAQAPARDLRPALVACALVVAASVAAAYVGGLHGAFVFDDLDSITGNASIRELSTSLTPPAGATVSGRPFLNLTLAVNYALGGTSPWGYHALNVAIHIAAALALLGVVRRTLATRAAGARPDIECLLLATTTSLIWALHPIQVESVGYVIQRAESLMGLLYLLTLYSFVRHAEGGRLATPWASASFVCCLLGMATKEAMATVPVIVFLYDRTFLAGSFRQAWKLRWRLYLLLAACWIPLAVQMAMGGGRSGTAGFGSGVSSWDYFLTQLRAIVLYLHLSVWPRHLVGDYGRILGGSTAQLVGCGVVGGFLVAATLILVVRRPALGFLGAWFFLILAPTTSFVPVSTEIIALHRMYLPLAALALAAAMAVRWRLGNGVVPWVVLAVLSACLGFVTHRRDHVYQGPTEFWSDVARKAPWNAGAWNNLGLISAEKGDQNAAIADFRHALAVAPKFATAHVNLGKALLAAGHPEEALSEFEAALEFLKFDPEVYHQMGKAFALQHQFGKAIEQLGESVNLDGNRADVWFDFGVVMEQAGNTGPAIYFYKRSVELNPSNVEARLDLGNLLAQVSRMPEAIVQYEDAARLQPNAADIHNNLGGLLAESGRFAEAKAQFMEALRLQPDYAEARDNLAKVNLLMLGGGAR